MCERGGIIEFGGLRNEKAKHFITMESLERVEAKGFRD